MRMELLPEKRSEAYWIQKEYMLDILSPLWEKTFVEEAAKAFVAFQELNEEEVEEDKKDEDKKEKSTEGDEKQDRHER